jgi:hypothetical protein
MEKRTKSMDCRCIRLRIYNNAKDLPTRKFKVMIKAGILIEAAVLQRELIRLLIKSSSGHH